MPKPYDITERTFAFVLAAVRLCRDLERRDDVCRTLSRQLLRSATSVGANVEEAKAGHSRADFICKYTIALKEARESRYWLRLLHEGSDRRDPRCAVLRQECEELTRIIAAIIVKAKAGATEKKPKASLKKASP
jgi:four helix bundle protein